MDGCGSNKVKLFELALVLVLRGLDKLETTAKVPVARQLRLEGFNYY